MPREGFSADFCEASARYADLVPRIDQLALLYGVTPMAAAVRAGIYDLAPTSELSRARQAIGRRRSATAPSGGDFYQNTVTRRARASSGWSSTRDADAVSSAGASKLLRTKVDNLWKLEAQVHARVAGG